VLTGNTSQYYGSTALCWTLAAFSVSLSYTQSVGLLGRGISPSQGLWLHKEEHKHRMKAGSTDISDLSEIRTHDHSVRASENSSCLRPRGHCDQRTTMSKYVKLCAEMGHKHANKFHVKYCLHKIIIYIYYWSKGTYWQLKKLDQHFFLESSLASTILPEQWGCRQTSSASLVPARRMWGKLSVVADVLDRTQPASIVKLHHRIE
jgi:hypothetical protein